MKVGGAGGPAWPMPDYSQPVENRGTDAARGSGEVQAPEGVDDVDPSRKSGQGVDVPSGYDGVTGATPATEVPQDPRLQFPPDDLVPDAGDVDGTDPARGALDPSRGGKAGAQGVDGVDGLDPARDVDPSRDPKQAELEDALGDAQQQRGMLLQGYDEDSIRNLQTWQGGGTDGRLDHFIKRMGLHSVLGDQESKAGEASDATKVQASRDARASQDNKTDE